MYLLFNSRYQISHRCFISWKVIFKTLHFSNIRLIIRSHVLQIDFTLCLKSTNLSNFDSFVFAFFASIYDLILQNLRHWKDLHESFKIRIVKRFLKVISLREFVDNNDNHSHVSINQEFTTLRKFARKFQNIHRYHESCIDWLLIDWLIKLKQ